MHNIALALALVTAFSMAGGQLLFKLGAAKWGGVTLSDWIISFITNPYLVVAVFLYATTILVWIYVLKVLPLSVAYPLTALAYIIVPLMSHFLIGEKITAATIVGSFLIMLGIAICQYQGAN